MTATARRWALVDLDPADIAPHAIPRKPRSHEARVYVQCGDTTVTLGSGLRQHCSRPTGHTGRHAAYGQTYVVAVWP